MLPPGLCDRNIFLALLLCHLFFIIIQVLNLRFINIQIQPAHIINGITESAKADCDKVLNVHIEVHIEHVDRLLRPALCIGRITFIIGIVAEIEICITIYRYQFDISGILIDGCDQNGIRSCILRQFSLTGIHTEQRNVHIPLHRTGLRILLDRFADLLIDLLCRNIHLLYLFYLGYDKKRCHYNQQYNEFRHEKDNSELLFVHFLSVLLPLSGFHA